MTGYEVFNRGRQTRLAILLFRMDGWTTKSIAGLLKITDATVEYHWSKIQKQAGVRDIVLITKWAIRNGLTTL